MRLKKLFATHSETIFLFLAALFIRFPFFFRDYIDQDESTFILMGQSIADGHLPYDHLWDLKPPLLFYFFGLIQYLFPDSFVAIRFFGVIVIFLSAWLLMKIAKESNLSNGFLIALGYVILSSEFGSLQGVMSEHLAVFFLLFGLLFFLNKKTTGYLITAGVAFSCAALCKLNYAYAIVALMVADCLATRKEKIPMALTRVLGCLATGILIPVVVLLIPFLVNNKLDVFVNSVFLAPLEYGSALQYEPLKKLSNTWWVILGVLGISYWALRSFNEKNKRVVLICIGILIGTSYTFYSSGIVNGHYLVQLYPFILLLIFGLLVRKSFKPGLAITALVVFLISVESLTEYYRLIKGKVQNSTVYVRPSFEVISELEKRNLDTEKIFFADYHIGYWLLDKYPLTKSTTHPSNISRPYLFKYFGDSSPNSLDELKYIMEEVKPEVVVSKYENLDFFPESSPENDYFRESLNEDFRMIYKDTTDRIYIWERVDGK